jgi:hypothetical protein
MKVLPAWFVPLVPSPVLYCPSRSVLVACNVDSSGDAGTMIHAAMYTRRKRPQERTIKTTKTTG